VRRPTQSGNGRTLSLNGSSSLNRCSGGLGGDLDNLLLDIAEDVVEQHKVHDFFVRDLPSVRHPTHTSVRRWSDLATEEEGLDELAGRVRAGGDLADDLDQDAVLVKELLAVHLRDVRAALLVVEALDERVDVLRVREAG
jgi:hypothetical protein